MAISTKIRRECDRCGHAEDQDPDNVEKWGSVGALLAGEKVISLEGGNQDFCPECINALLAWYDSGSKYSEPSRPAEIRYKSKLLTAVEVQSITELIAGNIRAAIVDHEQQSKRKIGSDQIIEGGLARIDSDARTLLVQILGELGLRYVKAESRQDHRPAPSSTEADAVA